MLLVVRIMLLRINYETKLKLKASVILILLIVLVILLSTRLSLLADDAAAWETNNGDVAHHRSTPDALAMTRREEDEGRHCWCDYLVST
jgi:hypothetical protein